MRLRLFQIIDRAQGNDTVSKWYDVYIVCVAFLSIVPLMFKSDNCSQLLIDILRILDLVTVVLLYADYLFRWITYDMKTEYGKKSFFYFPFTPTAIIDLLSILPSLTILPDGFKFLRVLRMVRILRMSKGLTIMTNVFLREARYLSSVLLFICVYIFTTALIMFTVETDTFKNFFEAVYWSTTALATIGYGDVSPVSDVGRAVSVISAIIGIMVIAFPAGIITAGYLNQIELAKKDGLRYFRLPTMHDKTFKGRRPDQYKSLKQYFKRNKKIRIYLIIMICLLVLSFPLEVVLPENFNLFLFMDYTSTITALILEPTAGFMVGIGVSLIHSIYVHSGDKILYFIICSIQILSFGILCRKGKKFTFKTALALFILSFCVMLPLQYVYFLFLDSDSLSKLINSLYSTYETFGVVGFFESVDFRWFVLYFVCVQRLISFALMLASALFIRLFVYGTTFDPMEHLPKVRRYKFKIYSKKKKDKSYLQKWIEQLQDNRDDTDWNAVVNEGKKSIEATKKNVKKRKEKLRKMEDEVQAQQVEISKHVDEIARVEEKIDLQKKAVRRAKVKKVLDQVKVTSDDENTDTKS